MKANIPEFTSTYIYTLNDVRLFCLRHINSVRYHQTTLITTNRKQIQRVYQIVT